VTTQGHARTRSLVERVFPSGELEAPLAATDLFAPELDGYAEIVLAPGEMAFGFMTRGEDAGFAARVARVLDLLEMPERARAHHRALAAWFEHKRAFCKVEWRRQPDGPIRPRVSIYFRRRPAVDVAVERLGRLGVSGALCDHVREVARVAGKTSIHFVAAAFAAGEPVHHKLYFSQYASPEERGEAARRAEALLALHGIPDGARARWRRSHDGCVGEGSPTFFASIGFTDDALAPTLKLDYARVTPWRAGEWLDGDQREAAVELATGACRGLGLRELSYLGVRFAGGDDGVRLKYYLDIP
jgi:hypothetical protein